MKNKTSFNISGDILDLRIMTRGRTTYKARCDLNDKKQLRLIMETLQLKFNINLKEMILKEQKIEQDWFQ